MSFEIDVRKRLGEAEVALTLAAGDGAHGTVIKC